MKKLVILLASALLGSAVSFAQPQGAPQGQMGGRPTLTTEQKNEMAQKQTDQMIQKYGLTQAQGKKLLKLNKKYADVLRPEKPDFDKKNAGDNKNSRPTPPNKGQRPNMGQGGPQGGPGMGPGMGQGGPQGGPMGGNDNIRQQRQKYEKKLSKILNANQFAAWEEDQMPPIEFDKDKK